MLICYFSTDAAVSTSLGPTLSSECNVMVWYAFILKSTGLVCFFNLSSLMVLWFRGLSQLIMMEEKTQSTEEGRVCARCAHKLEWHHPLKYSLEPPLPISSMSISWKNRGQLPGQPHLQPTRDTPTRTRTHARTLAHTRARARARSFRPCRGSLTKLSVPPGHST